MKKITLALGFLLMLTAFGCGNSLRRRGRMQQTIADRSGR